MSKIVDKESEASSFSDKKTTKEINHLYPSTESIEQPDITQQDEEMGGAASSSAHHESGGNVIHDDESCDSGSSSSRRILIRSYKDEKSEECPICYESFSSSSPSSEEKETEDDNDNESILTYSLRCRERIQLESCGHKFCKECLIDHCKHAITIRQIPIPCPSSASDGCTACLQDNTIQEVLLCGSISGDIEQLSPSPKSYGSMMSNSEYWWNRYLRFKRLKEDPSLISCTRCNELMSKDSNHSLNGDARDESNNDNNLTCPSCGHMFCSIHGDAHPGFTCEEHKTLVHIRGRNNRKRRLLDRKSQKLIRKYTKPCSHCGVPIQKESGCDHIVCTSCDEDMCFKCGTHIHLTGEMVRSCKNCEQNFIDHRHIWAYRMTLCLSLPFYIPLCLIHIVVMTVLAIASFGCFCCFCCGISIDTDDNHGPSIHRGNASTKNGSSKDRLSFSPLKGVRTVLGMILLPFLDLFRQCGVPCCLDFDIFPDIESSKTTEMQYDYDDDDDENNSVVDLEE